MVINSITIITYIWENTVISYYPRQLTNIKQSLYFKHTSQEHPL